MERVNIRLILAVATWESIDHCHYLASNLGAGDKHAVRTLHLEQDLIHWLSRPEHECWNFSYGTHPYGSPTHLADKHTKPNGARLGQL
jgi:hypothetical protein